MSNRKSIGGDWQNPWIVEDTYGRRRRKTVVISPLAFARFLHM